VSDDAMGDVVVMTLLDTLSEAIGHGASSAGRPSAPPASLSVQR